MEYVSETFVDFLLENPPSATIKYMSARVKELAKKKQENEKKLRDANEILKKSTERAKGQKIRFKVDPKELHAKKQFKSERIRYSTASQTWADSQSTRRRAA